jgi:hypothetical protein
MNMRLQTHNFHLLHQALEKRFELVISFFNSSSNPPTWQSRFKAIVDEQLVLIDLIDGSTPLVLIHCKDWNLTVSAKSIERLKSYIDRATGDCRYQLGGF